MSITITQQDRVFIVGINRPAAKNSVDRSTAALLADAFRQFDQSSDYDVAVLHGVGDTFCAGADLKAVAKSDGNNFQPVDEADGPMGPTRMLLSKPVIAAIEGYAVAGGIELALWCDLRVMASNATLGVFCRRFGVPLIDGGTARLPRLIGESRAMDLILTGRAVDANEAEKFGLANRVCPPNSALETAVSLAKQISAFPQTCLRNDRLATIEQHGRSLSDALKNEYQRGRATIESGETVVGATSFTSGIGRHGKFDT